MTTPTTPASTSPLWQLLGSAALALGVASCSSSDSGLKGVPSNLPTIPLYDSPHTPAHSLPHADYPFAPNGSYITAWAAEGGARPATGASSGSHHSDGGTSSSSRSRATPTKKSSSQSKSGSTSKSKSTGGTKHTVKSSDSLYTLARKYGTTVAKIKAANGLKSDLIRDGRKLTIPK